MFTALEDPSVQMTVQATLAAGAQAAAEGTLLTASSRAVLGMAEKRAAFAFAARFSARFIPGLAIGMSLPNGGLEAYNAYREGRCHFF